LARHQSPDKTKRSFGIQLTWKLIVFALVCLAAYSLTVGGIPSKITLIEGNTREVQLGRPLDLRRTTSGLELLPFDGGVELIPLSQGESRLEVRLWDLIPIKRMIINVVPDIRVLPGGQSIGVLLPSRGVVVIGHYPIVGSDGRSYYPAREAGIQAGDIILRINGQPINSKSQIESAIDNIGRSGGQAEVTVSRNSRKITVRLKPVAVYDERLSDEPGMPHDERETHYKLGIWVRENAAGVGTLSFYHPNSGVYCALGHVITDTSTNKDMDVASGMIVSAQILGIHQGSRGQPGEKIGTFSGETDIIGTIDRNTKFGIFGKLTAKPINPYFTEPIPVALSDEVVPGPAYLYTVLEEDRIEQFHVEIQRVARQTSPQIKGLVIRVTDPRLLSVTGGIVQGMSGSPIIQNNKLAGVLTHVFVSDQTRGYGVLAEWLVQDANFRRNYHDSLIIQ
jgi:stage IV sporulation protein B